MRGTPGIPFPHRILRKQGGKALRILGVIGIRVPRNNLLDCELVREAHHRTLSCEVDGYPLARHRHTMAREHRTWRRARGHYANAAMQASRIRHTSSNSSPLSACRLWLTQS